MPKAEQPNERKPRASDGQRQAPPSEPREAKTEEPAHAGLEQIREILFGAAQRDLERRLDRIDAHLLARAGELEQESRRRTEVLEGHLKKEMESLAARFDRERNETADAIRRLSREQHDAIANLEQKLIKVEDGIGQSQRETRRQLLDQEKTFLDELQRLRKELLTTLQQELRLSEGEYLGEFRDGEEQIGH